MFQFKRLMLSLMIVLVAATALSGCIVFEVDEDPAVETCNDFDSYLASCASSCAADWDCEYWYDTLDWDTQNLLDECSQCLDNNSYSCSDCVIGGSSCFELLSSYLGMSCTW